MTDAEKHAGRTQSRRPEDKRKFVGESGAVFVPHPLIDEKTIESMVEGGQWSPVEEKKPAKKSSK